MPPRLPTLFGVVRRLRLDVPDLLEHLAHPGAHQVARFSIGITVAPPIPRRLARVNLVGIARAIGIFRHGRIVGRLAARVNDLR